MTETGTPLFAFAIADVCAPGSAASAPAARREFPLLAPRPANDRARLPARGDLAHIRLAGQVFVPHYAAPLPRRIVAAGATLYEAGRADAVVLGTLAGGGVFEVLDIAGGWVWGQAIEATGEPGLVGYLPLAALAAA